MAKLVVLGLAGDSGVWLADLDRGTVTAVDPATIAQASASPNSFLGAVTAARSNGYTIVQGVNLAVATTNASIVSAQEYFVPPQ